MRRRGPFKRVDIDLIFVSRLPCRELTYPHLGKREESSKVPFGYGDILVAMRVFCVIFLLRFLRYVSCHEGFLCDLPSKISEIC